MLYPVYKISGIRYIRFALNPVCVNSSLSKKSKGEPFCNIEKFFKKRYIRNSLNPDPVYVKSGFGCVIVEWDSLARFTALEKLSKERYIRYMLQHIKLIRSVTSLVWKNT